MPNVEAIPALGHKAPEMAPRDQDMPRRMGVPIARFPVAAPMDR